MEPQPDLKDSSGNPPDKPVLSYLSPCDDYARQRFEVTRKILGALFAIGMVFFAAFVLIISNLKLAGIGPGTYTFVPLLQTLGVALVVGLIISLHDRKRHGSRAFAVGMLIGLGIAMLIEGACFAMGIR